MQMLMTKKNIFLFEKYVYIRKKYKC